ncbi:hypothetical protein [Halocatena pleomorpha]|uniref:Uncharacterized protein n=1 Tax=Halocatena pleomorpha TaxID=1785090 RepID=A0A3P3R383_9EURY|nr:hypothetical protein [Halocatena pleomorpha]RRJ27814.1 hypothetical protein EIK79_17175 [Halocatena pleomorpha]
MGTTAHIVEYSIALWLAMNNVIEIFLQRLVGMAAWASLPDWLGPTAFNLYVPVIVANLIVLRYPSVSRRRFWVFCLTTKVVSLFLFAPILLSFAPTSISPSQHLPKALAFLGAWFVAAAFSHAFVTNDGYRRAYRRFEAQSRV